MSRTWYSNGCDVVGPFRTRRTTYHTPRSALATAEFRVGYGGVPQIAFRLKDRLGDAPLDWTVEVRRGCEICARYNVSGVDGYWVFVDVCACCLDCDVYTVALLDDKCEDCATVYLDLMKAEGYGQASEACTCGDYDE